MDLTTLNNLVGISPWAIIKIPVIILLAFYLIFAFVIVRQVRVMTDTLDIGLEVPIKIVSYIHFLFALFLLIFAIFAL